MKRRSPGERLRGVLRSRRLSYRKAASRLNGVNFGVLHQVAHGVREPGLSLAVAIEREFGIPACSWPSLREPVTELLRLRGAA